MNIKNVRLCDSLLCYNQSCIRTEMQIKIFTIIYPIPYTRRTINTYILI